MDKTLEARLLGRDNVVLDVWYYCCAYVASMMCAHAVLCIYSVCTCCLYNVMYAMVWIVLCEYFIWCCVHVAYAVLGIDGVMYKLYMH